MPIVHKQHTRPVPEVHHSTLDTTFYGIEHPASTPEAPIHQYLGIKYATVPGRFRQSKLFSAYPPITDASRYGPICPQLKGTKSAEEELFGLAPEDIPKQSFKQDEFECLNLNITCPGNATPQSRLPVMLWVHGGGDRGSGSSWIYDGGPLVRKSIAVGKPIILVTFNFRIGLFGFAAGPLIREDNESVGDEGVGNYGLRDQRRAMKWLHQYIHGFGGDPNNITLFGESSGGADILCHLLSAANEVRPAFQRAIIQSAILEHNLPDVSCAGWHLSRVMTALRISTIAQLRAVEPEKLVALGQTLRVIDDGFFFRKDWKNFFATEDRGRHHLADTKQRMARSPSVARSPSHVRARPSSLLRPPSKARSRSARSRSRVPSSRISGGNASTPILQLPPSLQPLIIGDSACDSHLWALPASLWTSPAVVRRLKAVCQSVTKTNNVLRAYDISAYTPDEEITERVLDLVNDARVAWPTECVAHSAKRERGGRGVWRYVFDQEGPGRGVPHHAADLGYLFDNVPLPESALATSAASAMDTFCEGGFDEVVCYGDVDDDEELTFGSVIRDDDGDEAWGVPVVDEWTYTRVRDAMQERWIAFANGEAPWKEDKVYVFGPEGETGERSNCIFEGRRRKQLWREALEPLGMQLVQKLGVELSRGPPLSGDRARF